MSFDHSVVVRGRKRKTTKIRAIAARLAPLLEQDANDVEDEQEIDLHFDGVGSMQIRRLVRGYEISLDSNRDGNRENWEALGELVASLAKELGEIIDDRELAAEMCIEGEPEEASPDGRMAVLTIEDREGNVVERGVVFIEHLAQILDPAGMPFARSHFAWPAMFDEAHRYPLGGSCMRARLHDADGIEFRTIEWPLDGYGRITGVETTELAEKVIGSRKRAPRNGRAG